MGSLNKKYHEQLRPDEAYKILVASGNESVRKTLQKILESYGYQVTLKESGTEALNEVHTNYPNLILSDVNLLNMNGYQLCRCLKSDPVSQVIPFVL